MPKKRITVELESSVFKELQRRAKKEFLSLRELTEDILRRSAVMSKSRGRGGRGPRVKADKFIQYFSRYQPYTRRKKRVKGKSKRR